MPKKKLGKKKGKTSASKSSKEDKHADPEDYDPSTLIHADGTEAGVAGMLKTQDLDPSKKGKKKKKGRKKKMSKSDKDLSKIEKQCDKIKANKAVFHDFINRMDRWLVNNARELRRFFRRFDEDEEGIITYDDFKAGIFDLMAPCNKIETHMLAKLLDRENTGDIDFMEFGKGLKYIRELEDLERDEEEADKILILTERVFEHCKCCTMAVCGPYQIPNPKFVQLELRLITFNDVKNHPGHFEMLVHSHIPVSLLHHLIFEETSIKSTKLSIFYDISRSQKATLPIHLTLKELGFEGDNYDSPEEVTLYYDYKVEFTDCPILLCDHYFGQKVEVNLAKMVM